MCQCRNTHTPYIYVLSTVHVRLEDVGKDVACNNKLQANLWRQSILIASWSWEDPKKKASTNKLKFFRIPTWLSNYPLRGLRMFMV